MDTGRMNNLFFYKLVKIYVCKSIVYTYQDIRTPFQKEIIEILFYFGLVI